jgi:hypothetical protein
MNSWKGHTQPAQVMVDEANAKVGCETVHQPMIDTHSLHQNTNENGLSAGKQMAIKSTYLMHKRIPLQTWKSPDGHTFNPIDHCLIKGRHFSDS